MLYKHIVKRSLSPEELCLNRYETWQAGEAKSCPSPAQPGNGSAMLSGKYVRAEQEGSQTKDRAMIWSQPDYYLLTIW